MIPPKFRFLVPTRSLFFIAGAVWTFAGFMLLFRGCLMLLETGNSIWIKLIISIALGLLFYFFLFNKISSKHVSRLESKNSEYSSVFSFFNARSYLLMALMITMGVVLRKTEIVSIKYLAILYVTMGTPLAISAFKFYTYGFRNLKKTNTAK